MPSPASETQRLSPSAPEIADSGTLRLGSGCITAEFPPLRQPKPEIADRANLRLGSGCITAEFPAL